MRNSAHRDLLRHAGDVITASDVQGAVSRIAGHVRVTPVTEADAGTFPPAARVWLKLEQLQHTGSFKARGAFNRILSAAEQNAIPAAGVVAASGGNAGLAVAYAAAQQGLPARVHVPAAAPAVKVARLHAAMIADGPVDVSVSGIAADSLGATRLGDIGYAVAIRTGVRSVLVDDADIIAARQYLWDGYRLATEHGGATALAALLAGAYQPEPGERIAIVLCGANTDAATLA